MYNFKVGDIVIGNEDSDSQYSVTNSRCICKIVSIKDQYSISVKPTHIIYKNKIEKYGNSCDYTVSKKYFKPYKSNPYEVTLI